MRAYIPMPDEELRDALERAAAALEEFDSRRPREHRTNPDAAVTVRVGECREGIRKSLEWARVLQ